MTFWNTMYSVLWLIYSWYYITHRHICTSVYMYIAQRAQYSRTTTCYIPCFACLLYWGNLCNLCREHYMHCVLDRIQFGLLLYLICCTLPLTWLYGYAIHYLLCISILHNIFYSMLEVRGCISCFVCFQYHSIQYGIFCSI